MSKSDNNQRNVFRENAIHVGAGFVAKERPHVLQALFDASAPSGEVGSQ